MNLIISLYLLGLASSLRTWSNGRYETSVSDLVSVGGQLEVMCRVLDLGGDRQTVYSSVILPTMYTPLYTS